MRGLASVSAAAVLLSVSAMGQTHHEPTFDKSIALITLNTQVAPAVVHPLTLRLDVRDSDHSCDPDKIAIYGEPLPLQSAGRGQGPLQLSDGTVVSAQWAFLCHSTNSRNAAPGLILDFKITARNGEPLLHETGFIAHLRQKDWVELISFSSHDAANDVEVVYFKTDESRLFSDDFHVVSDGVSKEIEDIYWFWQQSTLGSEKTVPNPDQPADESPVASVTEDVEETADHLDDGIMAKKFQWQRIGEISQDVTPEDHDQNPEEATSETSSLPQEDESAQESQGDQDLHFKLLPNPSRNRKMKPLTSTIKPPSPPLSVTSTPTPTARHLPSLSPPDQDLVMTLTIAAAAFSLFSIIGIIAGTRRLAPHIQRRPRQRETREERLARVAERRRAVANFFRCIFCGLFGHDEKMDGRAPQGRDLRGSVAGGRRGQESDDTTMEQELAGLRNAADMVSNLIAAEEGRNNQVLQQHWQQQQQQQLQEERRPEPPTVPDPIRAAYPGYHPGESQPPSYENDTVDASMVADGFRYTPGGVEHPPSSNNSAESGGWVQGTSNSDRLGYGNKD